RDPLVGAVGPHPGVDAVLDARVIASARPLRGAVLDLGQDTLVDGQQRGAHRLVDLVVVPEAHHGPAGPQHTPDLAPAAHGGDPGPGVAAGDHVDSANPVRP